MLADSAKSIAVCYDRVSARLMIARVMRGAQILARRGARAGEGRGAGARGEELGWGAQAAVGEERVRVRRLPAFMLCCALRLGFERDCTTASREEEEIINGSATTREIHTAACHTARSSTLYLVLSYHTYSTTTFYYEKRHYLYSTVVS